MAWSPLDLLTGGASHSTSNAIQAADTIGTAQRQAYGGELYNLVQKPSQAAIDKSPLGKLISSTAGTMMGSPALASMMTPFIQQVSAMDFSSYLGKLAQLSGASAGTRGMVGWDMAMAGSQYKAAQDLFGGFGRALGMSSGGGDPGVGTGSGMDWGSSTGLNSWDYAPGGGLDQMSSLDMISGGPLG